MLRPALRSLIGTALLALSLTGCSEPTSPANPEDGPRAFLNLVVERMEQSHYRKYEIDWRSFRDTVFAYADGATTVEATHPAIQLALTMLADNHTWFRLPSGSFLNYPRTINCAIPSVQSFTDLPADIGYVRIAAFGGDAAAAAAYTSAIQDAFRAQDSDSLVGWIIDVRGNTGGNMWPMLAALWPFLQGTAGHFVDPDTNWTVWTVDGPRSYLGGQLVAEAATPFAPRGVNGRVAVLTDGRVASSGEATTIAFRGRPSTRSFGTSTCGLSTGISGLPIAYGYTLGLAQVIMADRNQTAFGGSVDPDETIVDAALLKTRAIEWIRTGT